MFPPGCFYEGTRLIRTQDPDWNKAFVIRIAGTELVAQEAKRCYGASCDALVCRDLSARVCVCV